MLSERFTSESYQENWYKIYANLIIFFSPIKVVKSCSDYGNK